MQIIRFYGIVCSKTIQDETYKIWVFDIFKKGETDGLIKSEFELNPTTSQFARLTIHHIS